MNDSQAWAAEQFSTSKSKERGIVDISTFKSCAPGSDRKIEVYCVKGADCVTLRMFCEGRSLTIDLSIADAIDLAHTIEDLADSEGGEKKQQPRRPDEVGVWECWFEHQPHDKWQATVTSNTRGTWFSSKFGDHHIDDLCESVVGVRIGDLPSEDPAPLPAEPRYFVDERGGCIAVRDRLRTDPDYPGLHSDTEGVVWYSCGVYRDGEWQLDPGQVEEAKRVCEVWNAREQVKAKGTCVPADAPAEAKQDARQTWPLNGEWGEVGQLPYQEGEYRVEWPETSFEGVRYIAHHETNGWRMSSERLAAIEGYGNMLDWFGKCRFRYLRPLDEQEPKPQLIDAVMHLFRAIGITATQVREMQYRSGIDETDICEAQKQLDYAAEILNGLAEVNA